MRFSGCLFRVAAHTDRKKVMVTRRLLLQTAALPLGGAPRQTLKFVFARPFDDARTQWLIRVFREVCAMCDLGFEFVDVPPRRATAMVLSGQVDGELGRTYSYLDFFPTLIRLHEPTNTVEFCVYGAGPRAHFDGLDKLKQQGQRCECRLGIKELEDLLGKHTYPHQLSMINDVALGVQKLLLGRTDLYFDLRAVVADYLALRLCNKDLQRTAQIRELGTILSTTAHVYLGPAHARHAPRMSEALAQLKRNGKVVAYRDQALLEYQQRCSTHPPAI